MNKSRFRLFAGGCVAIAACTATLLAGPVSFSQMESSRKSFLRSKPGVRMFETTDRTMKIAHKQLATARTPEASAQQALSSVAPILGVDPEQFIPVGPFRNGQHELGLMYRPETDDYKFTAYYWTQTAGGLPVFRSRFMALVRNDVGFPTVQVSADTRPIGEFEAPGVLMVNHGMALNAAGMHVGPNPVITEPEMVVYAGMGEKNFVPVTAMVFEATSGQPNDADYAKRLLVVDIGTGDVVYEENMILHGVSGVVRGLATQGVGADECEAEAYEFLPYALVTGGGQSAYADENGAFQLDTSGTVTVSSDIRGQWFVVNNNSGSNGNATASIPDGGSSALDHNFSNTQEQNRAEVNAYIYANRSRDFVLEFNPNYPTIFSQEEFPVNTGVSGSCNAFYDYSSINFYNAGGGCNNTAFSVVVIHEYGHHVIDRGGSGQGAYGEGMADALGVLMTETPQLAIGFFQGDCSNGIRNADNGYQYGGSCSGIHDCGQLISGCVWDSLQLVDRDIVAGLAINAIPLHSGTSIDPSIFLDWLTLDDDDGDLSNGTPNSGPLTQAFALHNMSEIPEPLTNDDCASATEISWGDHSLNTIGGSTSNDSYDESDCSGTYLGQMYADVWFRLVACGTGTMTVSTCNQITFDSDIVIYQGDGCSSKSQVACNGDGPSCDAYSSLATVDVTEGETYFIRVGGWEGGSQGSGTLTVSGPGAPCESGPVISVGYPDGRPNSVDPNGGTQVSVQIVSGSASPVPSTEQLVTRESGGLWASQGLSNQGGGSYVGIFPSFDCNAEVEWYITMELSTGGTYSSPSGGASSPWTATTGGFADDMESDKGWSVSGDASTGAWSRGVPSGSGGDRCDAPSDADSSGSAYVTGNTTDEDVDGGTTTLTSPDMDASNGGTLAYWRWYSNGSDCGGADAQNDVFVVEASSNGGSSWYNVETVGPTGGEVSGGWYQVTVPLADLSGFTPSSNFRVRFVCGDLNSGSIVEAAVDGVVLDVECAPDCPGDLDQDGQVGLEDFSYFLIAFGTSDPDADIDGNGSVGIEDFSIILINWGFCDS